MPWLHGACQRVKGSPPTPTSAFPSREKGSRFSKPENFLFAWDFVGVAGWTLPEVIIIDLSGQNNKTIAQADFKFQNRRLFGHERKVPDGYVQCFGGQSLYIDAFSQKQNLVVKKNLPLSDGKIKGCEDFWKNRLGKNFQKEKPKMQQSRQKKALPSK